MNTLFQKIMLFSFFLFPTVTIVYATSVPSMPSNGVSELEGSILKFEEDLTIQAPVDTYLSIRSGRIFRIASAHGFSLLKDAITGEILDPEAQDFNQWIEGDYCSLFLPHRSELEGGAPQKIVISAGTELTFSESTVGSVINMYFSFSQGAVVQVVGNASLDEARTIPMDTGENIMLQCSFFGNDFQFSINYVNDILGNNMHIIRNQ